MTNDADRDIARLWRIGELAEATGMTVRTLHHYEDLGLMRPSSRTLGGHRLYDERDVQRLYRVRALRDLGLSLTEVRGVLEASDPRLGDLLNEHIDQVGEQIEQLAQLRQRLRTARRQVDDGMGAEELLATIEAMSRLANHAAKRRSGSLAGSEATGSEARWRRAGQELRHLMESGVRPSDPRVFEVAARIDADIRSFAADDPGIVDALGQLRRTGGEFELAGWDRPLLKYLDQALISLSERNQPHG